MNVVDIAQYRGGGQPIRRESLKVRGQVYELEFDAERHLYRVNGRVVGNVTSILRDAALTSAHAYATEDQRDQGTTVHKAVPLALQGRLKWSSVAEELQPRVNAALEFVRLHDARLVACEKLLYSAAFDYAGTLDAVFEIGPWLALVDWKRGLPEAATALQTAAYAAAWFEETDRLITKRFGVQLCDDGTPKVTEYADMYDQIVFRAALVTGPWRREHGLCA